MKKLIFAAALFLSLLAGAGQASADTGVTPTAGVSWEGIAITLTAGVSWE